MFKITQGTNQTLADLEDELGKYLNPKAGKRYTDRAMISRLKKLISDPLTTAAHLPFYNYLVANNNRVLKAILVVKPRQLGAYIAIIDNLVASGAVPAFYSVGKKKEKKSTDFGKEVLQLFGYSNYRSTRVFHRINKSINRKFCNYCNLDTTLSLETGESLFDCDHYFPKVEYPYLSVSFYNLISSCTNCNSRIKSVRALDLKKYPHPYLDEVHDYIRFTTDLPLDIGNNIDNFKIVVAAKSNNALKALKGINLVAFFSVDKRYSELPDDVSYLFRKSEKLSAAFKHDLYVERQKLGIPVTKQEIIDDICYDLKVPIGLAKAANTQMGKLKLDMAAEYKITELF